MKAIRQYSFSLFPFLLFLLSSCFPHQVAVNTMQPGVAKLPKNIQKFVLLDLTKKHHESLCALQIGLAKDSFTSVIHKQDTSIPAAITTLISWEEVAALLHYDTSAGLIVLEKTGKYIRVDPTVTKRVRKEVYSRPGELNRYAMVTEYGKELCYTYQWKVYDYKSKAVFGSYYYEHTDSSHWFAGNAFANRLLPHPELIYRKYYVSGGKNMRSAGFLVRKGQWAKAIAMWERETKSRSLKTRRKAYYNLAIAEEKAGNLNRAIEYATRAKLLGEPEAEFYILSLQYELRALE